MVRLRILPTDENFSLRGQALEHEVEKDLERGLIPFFVQATSGYFPDPIMIKILIFLRFRTTSVSSFDNLEELTDVASRYGLWCHVDAAYVYLITNLISKTSIFRYGGCAMICPEFRHMMSGLDKADSLNVNVHKMLLVSCFVQFCGLLYFR